MKRLLLITAATCAAFAPAAPVFAAMPDIAGIVADNDNSVLDRQGRGRGRGRGGDDDRRGGHGSDRHRGGSNDDASGSGRSRPRVPGGSGCDDPGDVAEHAGCSG
ncbi:MAG: hypothetical protein WBB85_11720 [Albidovulum sp.]|uniref:hypothetical protein n=1 Tax=Albidovulum sp. TaxID=1872424 RepID=UPI003CB97271